MVDIKGLDKARVLKALYDSSHPQGLGFLQAGGTITVEQCAELLENFTYFDYLRGRVLKVELSGDEFDERLYDRDNGKGAAQRAVDSIRNTPENGEDATKETCGEKKELSEEEKKKLGGDAFDKIMGILAELPPEVAAAVGVALKLLLPGPSVGGATGAIAMMAMMGGPSMPRPFPFKGRFG